MATVYEEYLVSIPQADASARLRQAAEADGWIVVEESASDVFCIERLKPWSYAVRGWASYLVLTAEDSPYGPAVRFVGWHGQGSRQHSQIWDLLVGAGLVPTPGPPGLHCALPQPVPACCYLDMRPPSWVRWTRFSEFGWALLMVPFITLLLVLDDAYALPLFAVWLFVIWLFPVLVTELVPRRALGIKSKRGICQSLIYMGGHLAIAVAIIVVVEAVLS